MVEVERLGFTILSSGESRDGTTTIGPDVNIVFIHGLRGHPRRTWECAAILASNELSTATKSKTRSVFKLLKSPKLRAGKSSDRHVLNNSTPAQTVYWPYDLLPSAVPNARIMTYGYNSDVIGGIFSAQNQNSILQHGNDLMVKLERAVQNEKPIIFLAHSLGGIVLKNALHRCQESLDSKFSNIVDRVNTVMFFGTPHRGSDIAGWGRIASNIANAALQDTNGSLLTDLQVDSQILDLIHDDFLKVLHKKSINIHSFQEGRGLTGVKGLSGKVVEDFSSKIGHSLEVLETIDANHMEMVRFDGPKNAGFREVSAALAGYVKGTSDKDESRPPYTYLNNFYAVDYIENLSKISVRHPNTCTWLPANETFNRWLYGQGPNMCWLHGFPGRGKSVIAKYVIESLQKEDIGFLRKSFSQSPFLAYFICSDQDEARKSPRNVLRSIIYQLLAINSEFDEALSEKYKTITNIHTDSVNILWDILRLVVSSMCSKPLIIVIDAFDELAKDSWVSFLTGIMNFLASHPYQAKIFVTSRTEPIIKNYFLPYNISDIVLSDDNNKADVAVYLSDTVRGYAVENSFDPIMQDTILHEIQSRADGMFLWATLAWENFKDGVGSWTKTRVEQKLLELQQLPPGLDSLYYSLLLKVDQRLHEELLDLLLWLVTTLRPLSLPELSTCLALDTKPSSSKNIDVKLSLQKFIERTLPHLVKVDQQNVVTLVHQSFKDFLLQTKRLKFQGSQASNKFFIDTTEANCRVAADCLTYLALDDIWMVLPAENLPGASGIYRLKEKEKFVFVEYALYQWAAHLKQVEDSHEVWIQFKRVLDNPHSWEALCYKSKHDTLSEHVDCTLPVFQAYFQGVRFLIRRLVEAGEDINKISKSGDTVLHRARLDDLSDIKFLLDLGADVNGKNVQGQTMLHRLGLFRDRQRLLDWIARPDVNINARQYDGATILHIVVQWEWTHIGNILNILLDRQDLDVNAMDTSGRTALTMAIHWGKEFATKSLLNCPRVKIHTARRGGGGNPLTNAASQCWTDILMNLLGGIDNIDEFADEKGRTVLHWTVINNMIEPLQLILTSKSFLVNRPDNCMMTALHYAAEEGLPVITRLLLEKGAITTVRNRLNETPIHVAANKGNKWVVEALLERSPRASINNRDRFGWTPTHRAVTSGNEALMKYLVNLPGVDLTLRDKHGRSVLAFVAAYGNPEMLEILLETTDGDSSQEFDHFGNSLLHLAAKEKNFSTTTFLLGRLDRSERNQLNFRGQTALDVVDPDTEIALFLGSKGVRSNNLRKPATCMFQSRVEESYISEPHQCMVLTEIQNNIYPHDVEYNFNLD